MRITKTTEEYKPRKYIDKSMMIEHDFFGYSDKITQAFNLKKDWEDET